MKRIYGDDIPTHTELDKVAYWYATGKAKRGICYGMGSNTKIVLWLLGP